MPDPHLIDLITPSPGDPPPSLPTYNPPQKPWEWYEEEEGPEITQAEYYDVLYNQTEGAFASDPSGELCNPQDDD